MKTGSRYRSKQAGCRGPRALAARRGSSLSALVTGHLKQFVHQAIRSRTQGILLRASKHSCQVAEGLQSQLDAE